MELTKHAKARLCSRFGIQDEQGYKDILSILQNSKAKKRVKNYTSRNEKVKFRYKGIYVYAILDGQKVVTVYFENQDNRVLKVVNLHQTIKFHGAEHNDFTSRTIKHIEVIGYLGKDRWYCKNLETKEFYTCETKNLKWMKDRG